MLKLRLANALLVVDHKSRHLSRLEHGAHLLRKWRSCTPGDEDARQDRLLRGNRPEKVLESTEPLSVVDVRGDVADKKIGLVDRRR